MDDTIIVALITGAVTLAGNLLANHSASKKATVEQAKRDQYLEDRLRSLEAKVDEHNGYAKRFGEIEKAIVRIDTKMESLIKK